MLTLDQFRDELIARGVRLHEVPQPAGKSVAKFIRDGNCYYLPEMCAFLLDEVNRLRQEASRNNG
jgi:hypothetical protein